jgi:hypothetical protein
MFMKNTKDSVKRPKKNQSKICKLRKLRLLLDVALCLSSLLNLSSQPPQVKCQCHNLLLNKDSQVSNSKPTQMCSVNRLTCNNNKPQAQFKTKALKDLLPKVIFQLLLVFRLTQLLLHPLNREIL